MRLLYPIIRAQYHAHPSFRRAAIAFALETSLTLPGVSIVGEEGVFRHLDGLTLVLGALETSLTLPGASIGDEEGVFNSGTTDARLTANTFDGVPILGTDSICIVPYRETE